MAKAKPEVIPAQAVVPAQAQPSAIVQHSHGATADAEAVRAAREIETAMIVAKKFPRDQVHARDRIVAMCSRPALAEAATYSYTRGNTIVEGPSIRLAEAIAQAWGNLSVGVQELSQGDNRTLAQSFCIDLETNTRNVKVFSVPHVRYTKEYGLKALVDPRDIYEMVANQAARRLRSCILAVIPGDVVDEALAACTHTLNNSGDAPADQLKKLVESFGAIGVSAEMLARRLGHRLEASKAAEVGQLRKVFAAIRDGMTTVENEFPPAKGEDSKPKTAAAAAAKGAAKKKSLSDFEFIIDASETAEHKEILAEAEGVLSAADFKALKARAEKGA